MTGTREKVRGHHVDRRRMAVIGFKEVKMCLDTKTERQNLTQSPCMLVLCLCFAEFWIKLKVISLCPTDQGPCRPLGAGRGS